MKTGTEIGLAVGGVAVIGGGVLAYLHWKKSKAMSNALAQNGGAAPPQPFGGIRRPIASTGGGGSSSSSPLPNVSTPAQQAQTVAAGLSVQDASAQFPPGGVNLWTPLGANTPLSSTPPFIWIATLLAAYPNTNRGTLVPWSIQSGQLTVGGMNAIYQASLGSNFSMTFAQLKSMGGIVFSINESTSDLDSILPQEIDSGAIEATP